MKRLFFRGDHKARAAEILFRDRERYLSVDYGRYVEVEVVWHGDGRYSMWGNLTDDTNLLQDTIRDPENRVKQVLPFADEVREEM